MNSNPNKTCNWSGACVPRSDYADAFYDNQKVACPGCKKMVKLRTPVQGGITFLQLPRHNRLEGGKAMHTDEQKKHRARANQARRQLFKEKEMNAWVRDGAGNRYRVGVFFVLAGDPGKAVEFLEWYEKEFPDDTGEPAFFLYSALSHYRAGSTEKARKYLFEAMLSNIYMLPELFCRPLPKQDIWHPCSYEAPEYLWEIEDLLEEPTAEEREWFREMFDGALFTQTRNKYIETFTTLKRLSVDDSPARHSALDSWWGYLASVRAGEI